MSGTTNQVKNIEDYKATPIPAINSRALRLEDLKKKFLERWSVQLMKGATGRYSIDSYYIRIENHSSGERCTFDYPVEDFSDSRAVNKIKRELHGVTLMKENHFRILLEIIDDLTDNPVSVEQSEPMSEYIVPHKLDIDYHSLVAKLLDYVSHSGLTVDDCERDSITKDTDAVRLTNPVDVEKYGKNAYIIKGNVFQEIFETRASSVIGSYHEHFYNLGVHIREAATEKRRRINRSNTCIGFVGYLYILDIEVVDTNPVNSRTANRLNGGKA